jgi:hypothetical protein
MKRLTRYARMLALAVFASVLSAQAPVVMSEGPELRLPGQRSRREEILKLDHKKNLEDAARLLELAQGLKSELEKSGRSVLPVTSLRKAEQIEKLARSIRSRLKRF